MSLSRSLVLIGAPLVGAFAVACSSSNTISPQPDASGTSSGSSSGSGSSLDSGSDDGGDAGSCPVSTAGYTTTTYVPAVANQGVCSTNDIAAFVSACGTQGGQSMCDTWQNTNVISDAGPGTPCGNCIFAPMNNGGTWTDPDTFFFPNYGGCIQLLGTTNGAACAAAVNNNSGCEGVACDLCPDTPTTQACYLAAEGTGGGCSQYAAQKQSACATESANGGAVAACSPGAGANNPDTDLTFVVTLICGGGVGDGGATDATSTDTGVADAGGG